MGQSEAEAEEELQTLHTNPELVGTAVARVVQRVHVPALAHSLVPVQAYLLICEADGEAGDEAGGESV